MRLSFVVEASDGVRDGAFESVGIGEGAVGELMLLEVAPASFDSFSSGAYFGSHSTVSQVRSASAFVVSLLVWIGPLSRTATSGRVRSAVP
jgi:hypothetical protein